MEALTTFIETHEPTTFKELAINPQKLKQIESWILKSIEAYENQLSSPDTKFRPDILLLYGISGSCKSVSVNVVCQLHQISIIDRQFESIHLNSNHSATNFRPHDIKNEDSTDFSISSAYPQLSLFQANGNSQQAKKSSQHTTLSSQKPNSTSHIVVFHDIPEEALSPRSNSFSSFLQILEETQCPTILIVSDTSTSDSTSISSLTKSFQLNKSDSFFHPSFSLLRHRIQLTTIHCPPITPLRVKKALQRILEREEKKQREKNKNRTKKELKVLPSSFSSLPPSHKGILPSSFFSSPSTLSFLEWLSQECSGDLRHATTQLQFYLLSSYVFPSPPSPSSSSSSLSIHSECSSLSQSTRCPSRSPSPIVTTTNIITTTPSPPLPLSQSIHVIEEEEKEEGEKMREEKKNEKEIKAEKKKEKNMMDEEDIVDDLWTLPPALPSLSSLGSEVSLPSPSLSPVPVPVPRSHPSLSTWGLNFGSKLSKTEIKHKTIKTTSTTLINESKLTKQKQKRRKYVIDDEDGEEEVEKSEKLNSNQFDDGSVAKTKINSSSFSSLVDLTEESESLSLLMNQSSSPSSSSSSSSHNLLLSTSLPSSTLTPSSLSFRSSQKRVEKTISRLPLSAPLDDSQGFQTVSKVVPHCPSVGNPSTSIQGVGVSIRDREYTPLHSLGKTLNACLNYRGRFCSSSSSSSISDGNQSTPLQEQTNESSFPTTTSTLKKSSSKNKSKQSRPIPIPPPCPSPHSDSEPSLSPLSTVSVFKPEDALSLPDLPPDQLLPYLQALVPRALNNAHLCASFGYSPVGVLSENNDPSCGIPSLSSSLNPRPTLPIDVVANFEYSSFPLTPIRPPSSSSSFSSSSEPWPSRLSRILRSPTSDEHSSVQMNTQSIVTSSQPSLPTPPNTTTTTTPTPSLSHISVNHTPREFSSFSPSLSGYPSLHSNSNYPISSHIQDNDLNLIHCLSISLDHFSDLDLLSSIKYDSSSFLDRSDSSLEIFPHGYVLSIASRSVACAKGSGYFELLREGKQRGGRMPFLPIHKPKLWESSRRIKGKENVLRRLRDELVVSFVSMEQVGGGEQGREGGSGGRGRDGEKVELTGGREKFQEEIEEESIEKIHPLSLHLPLLPLSISPSQLSTTLLPYLRLLSTPSNLLPLSSSTLSLLSLYDQSHPSQSTTLSPSSPSHLIKKDKKKNMNQKESKEEEEERRGEDGGEGELLFDIEEIEED